ncbi:hypothetical protein WJX75_006667 [Coccomyxa subellipsoidea]|uniref:Uncharacterized protein n=1 Tax=Coccomyxa subellipsoidea TaxID=248742 RepID=A0ABR2Z1U8_9CHLO
MFRVGSETELEHGSSCEGDLGPCTSDGMPVSAPSSAFNIGPSAQQKHPAPALLRREADSPSPQPMPPRARDTAAEVNVGLSKVVLDGESGEQKASLDSSASLWSPLLTMGVAGLQTTGTSSMQAEAAAAAARLPAAPSLQSWAGSLEVPGRAAGLSSTYSSPVAAVGGPQEIAPSSPAGPLQELLGAGRDADVSMQGGSVSLSMLAQGTSVQSSPQMPMTSREGTPTTAHGASWGAPDTPRPSAWEQPPSPHRPADVPAAQSPIAAGSSEGQNVRAGGGEQTSDAGQRQSHQTLQAVQADEDRRAADAASQEGRPAFRERTDSAIYHRGDQEEATSVVPSRVVRLEAMPSTVPEPAHAVDREQLGGQVTGGVLGDAGKKIAETPRREGSRRVADAGSCAHVLQAELGSSVVQLCRRSRDVLDAQGAQLGQSTSQAGVCAKGKCAVPWSSGAQAGSAPPSGELPKSSVRDDSARNSVGPTEADCADKVWPGLGLQTALTPNSGVRSFASAMDGSRMERELSSPCTSSALPTGQAEGLSANRLSGQRSSEQTSGHLGGHDVAGVHGNTRAHSRGPAQPGAAAARQVAAGDPAGGGSGSRSRSRQSVEPSVSSGNSGSPRLTEALLAELEAQQKLQARKEKAADGHGRTWAWLAAAELSVDTESRAKRAASAREKSLTASDSAFIRGRSSAAKTANKPSEPKKQKERKGLNQWFSCFVGGGTR